ncbi:D-glycero-beta-D-manno-heptose 1-phosphate adenylyltransferase [Streptomyces sp. NPDC060031]|uniref:D-glycero-beta-D-manno-heptose 1-phosphate adenylyltransferase n=1 Tax=Streptomyces sp. NPDC060031 TaxID=3347043 RepID=UPI003692EE72
MTGAPEVQQQSQPLANGTDHIEHLHRALDLLEVERIQAWGNELAARLQRGARLLAAGNGGSAAEAQHLTSELVGRLRDDRQPLSAIALHADTSAVTAIGNDYGYDEVFARQVRAHGRPGDVLLLLSTSGRSGNLLRAAGAARERGMTVWALTGAAPNPLGELADEAVRAHGPTATVQECHLVAVHVLCASVDIALGVCPPLTRAGGRLLFAGNGGSAAEAQHLTSELVGRFRAERAPLSAIALHADSSSVTAITNDYGPEPTAPADEKPQGIRRLVVVGDVLLDRDIAGTADRLSPEAPVPLIADARTTDRPGGAGLAALLAAREPGWHVTLVCGLGHDAPGARVRALLDEAGIEVLDLATSGTTPVKTRVRAADRTLLRYDTAAGPLPLGPLPDPVRTRLAEAAAVLVCDYGRGITSHDELRQALTDAAAGRPLVWDPHPNGTDPVPGTALAVPNADEALLRSGVPGPRDLAGDTARAVQLLAAWPVKQIAVTRGRDGAVLVADADGHPLAVPARPASGDTCGAGDQLAVTAAVMLGTGRLPSHALAAAVDAATSYVRAGGPAGLTTPPASGQPDPLEVAARVRERGGKVVGAGGCFDLLHAGHLSLLAQARQLGEVLIVCINSDASVQRLKGADRPVVGEQERAALLEALDCVDGVLVFGEDTPEKVLAELRPDIWVKGGDYAGRRIPEADLVESWGGEVVTVPYLDGYSTTTRIDRLTQQAGTR